MLYNRFTCPLSECRLHSGRRFFDRPAHEDRQRNGCCRSTGWSFLSGTIGDHGMAVMSVREGQLKRNRDHIPLRYRNRRASFADQSHRSIGVRNPETGSFSGRQRRQTGMHGARDGGQRSPASDALDGSWSRSMHDRSRYSRSSGDRRCENVDRCQTSHHDSDW